MFKANPNLYESPPNEKTTEFWKQNGQEALRKKLSESKIETIAKNAILFIGDGMGIGTTTATRVFKAQSKGKKWGEEELLAVDKFPFSGLSRTYCSNAQVPDSACTATAYLCGVKTNIVNLGVTANAPFKNCTAANDPKNQLESILTWAQKAGKATGIVTTTTVTHASPAGSYAHTTNRIYESDAEVIADGQNASVCIDIAYQLIHGTTGRNFDVIFGGGRTNFLPKGVFDESGKEGKRLDGRNLIEDWQSLHSEGFYITNRSELYNLDFNKTQKVLGLFNSQHLEFYQYAVKELQPSLTEMTLAAMGILSKNEKGYFLFVEGGEIDFGNHMTRAHLALNECNELDKAIENAVNLANPRDTLTVVTSDHSHPVNLAGYGPRGNDVLGVVDGLSDTNGNGFAALNYPVGPKQYYGEDIREELKDRLDFVSPSYINFDVGNHGGDDVSVYGNGPFGFLFSGSMEQNEIPHKIAYALCIGNGLTFCNDENVKK